VILVPGAGDETWRRLLQHEPPVVARRDDRGLMVDLRSVAPGDDETVAVALEAACRS
jgi:hypothetical protein